MIELSAVCPLLLHACLCFGFQLRNPKQRNPCHLPACFAPGMTYSTLQAFPLSCILITPFSAGFQEPSQQGVRPISGGFARIVNSISQEISYPASHSTSLDHTPLKFRFQGKAPGPCPYIVANSCQSLSLQSLSFLITPSCLHWVVLGFNPGYHPGSRERKWGTPKGRHCSCGRKVSAVSSNITEVLT